MLFKKYNFQCKIVTEALLPPYKGSTFRGVFGHALKDVTCPHKKGECGPCESKQKCVYAFAFETGDVVGPAEGSVVTTPPVPFVIEPPATTQLHFTRGERFDFNLLLFGKINRNFPYFLHAFERMGEIGIGKRISGKRGAYRLDGVTDNGRDIYDKAGGTIGDVDLEEELRLGPPENYPAEDFRLKLTLETPLRIKSQNRLTGDLPFDILARNMLRRVSQLMTCHGGGNPDLDWRGLVEAAGDVRMVENRLKWHDWRRYSQRQETGMNFGGIVGSAVYEGKIGPFMPFVEFCEKVHLGKQTTFGLGKIRAEIVNF